MTKLINSVSDMSSSLANCNAVRISDCVRLLRIFLRISRAFCPRGLRRFLHLPTPLPPFGNLGGRRLPLPPGCIKGFCRSSTRDWIPFFFARRFAFTSAAFLVLVKAMSDQGPFLPFLAQTEKRRALGDTGH